MGQEELTDPLLLRFAGDRADDVAALLAGENLTDLAEFIGALPEATAANIAARLPSWQLTGLLAVLEPESLCGMINAAPVDDAVALIAHLHESRYEALVAACPEGSRRSLQQLLQFPSHSLAALVTTEFVRVTSDTACKTFTEQLANSDNPSSGPVLVVDRKGKYIGMAELQAVIARKNRSRTAGDVAVKVTPLNGMTDAATALTAREWARHPELPVVDLQHRVLGIVSRDALLRVVGDDAPMNFSMERMLSELANGYLNICSRMLEAVLGRPK
jgi:Mg/Co/Ni transporter MgtE